jgi:nicotinate-nucleotide adenylyltransferase
MTDDMKKIYNLQELNFLQEAVVKIGILGGSFNLAHDGHLSISKIALKLYRFDYIIWLIAKQNPLKEQYKNSIYYRADYASKITYSEPKILISTAEEDLGTNFTYNSLFALINRFSKCRFTFLMGIDNVDHFSTWYRWEDVPNLCDIIIFDRPCKKRLVWQHKLYERNIKGHSISINITIMHKDASSSINNIVN